MHTYMYVCVCVCAEKYLLDVDILKYLMAQLAEAAEYTNCISAEE